MSVSEIEFCTLYVVAERWILGCILRFMHAKNHFSDTLLPIAADSTARPAGSPVLRPGGIAHRICGQGFVVRHTAHDPRKLELALKINF
jgi:hypothetical protein